MAKYHRKRLWVDPPFQARLLLRMGFYLILYFLTMVHVGFLGEVMVQLAEGGLAKNVGEMYVDFLVKFKPLWLSVILILPIIVYDLVKFSHRVAGPLFRCRKIMGDMAQGKTVPEFFPRKKDLMRDLFEAFNQVIKHHNQAVAHQTIEPISMGHEEKKPGPNPDVSDRPVMASNQPC
jgi:hypothetical protein